MAHSSSPFADAVIASMRRLYPEPLADRAWDNTGLLLEAATTSHQPKRANSVLLTIDLTRAVADEAIQDNHAVVVAYHPIIFRGLKSLTLADTQQQTLLRLAAHGISVYCPHTAVDAVPGGMADWLCDIVTGKRDGLESQAPITAAQGPSALPGRKSRPSSVLFGRSQNSSSKSIYSEPNYVASSVPQLSSSTAIPHTRSVITPSPAASLNAANSAHTASGGVEPLYSAENTGAGRLITFSEEQPIGSLISRIAAAVGHPKAFPLAVPQGSNVEDIYIKTVGLCPGSGSSVIRAASPPPDLVFTGEVSHHDALAVIERGGAIISLFHSNSERGYLNAVMKPQLEAELTKTLETTRGYHDAQFAVAVSQSDRDPFGIVVLEDGDDAPAS